MIDISAKVFETSKFLKDKFAGQVPEFGIIMGTGLGAFAAELDIIQSIDYTEIPHFVQSTVEFHKGKLLLGKLEGKIILIMQGRFHYYEGYSMQEITFPVRVMKAMNVHQLLLSNAAGGMNPDFKKGDLVLTTDHINLQPDNPLRSLSDPSLGPRFTDMSCPYSVSLDASLKAAAAETNIILKEGIYVSVMGPNLETRAEYRWLRSMGADMVGMSTVPEVIVANQVGLPCAAISVITDECDPDNLKPVEIAEIIAVAGAADIKLAALWKQLIVSYQ
ncbi:MAG: purine-nucleoside phosphorylase [Ferruginibacter sp.]